MSTDTSLPDDEDVEEFADKALALLADVDDPEVVYDALRRGDTAAAFDRIDADREDTETTLADLYHLSVAIAERNPEALDDLRDDVDSFRPAAKPPE
jgi:hypothetical protein